ncbi:MAG: tetratricopeptide repeat protein [Chitinispirillaceae bacterium]|nr:tetratricopeptide repeat protein [Chitinispirillaceae bacterium]
MVEKKIGDMGAPSDLKISYEKQLLSLTNECDSFIVWNTDVSDLPPVNLETEVTKLSALLFMENDPEKIFNTIAGYIYDSMKITVEKNENDLDAVFPQKILQSRRGTCLGISLLVMQIGEKLEFPIYGVLVPGHFFVRYSDGVVKRNFEPLRRGESMPEQWYREKWPTRDTSRYSLRNCTKREVIGVVCYVLGNRLFADGKYPEAVAFFDRAQQKFPELIEAQGNMAIAYEKIGQTEKSIKILGDMADRYPLMDGIHSRYASLLLKTGRYAEAESEFRKALDADPGNNQVLYGYAMALYLLKKCRDADAAISRVLFSKPDFEGASDLKSKIEQECR